MMQTLPLDIVGSTKFSRYHKISRESTYNMMISDGALIPFPGYRQIKVIKPGGSESRTIYNSPKYKHAITVTDDIVYTISNDFAVTRVGQLDSSKGAVFISENNNSEIAIVDNSEFVYVFNYALDTFTKISIPFIASTITFIDGYLIVNQGETHQWRLSGLNDATSWPFDSQHIGELESKPDICVAVQTLARQLFVFGTTTTEVWNDVPSNANLFPFQRQNSVNIDYGCLSINTIASDFNRIVWLASNSSSGATILVSTGGIPKKISTSGIDFELDSLTRPEDSFGFLFEEDGHIFYLITFPTDDVSYVYDFNEDAFFNVTDEKLGAHIARKISFFENKHIFITDTDGALYDMSSNYYTYRYTTDDTDAGKTIPRFRTTAPIRKANASRFVANVATITMEQGYSNESLAVDLSLSKDGAEMFGNKVRAPLRPMGKRQNKMEFRKLGSANDLTCQFRFLGKDKFVVTGATMEISA